VGPGHATRANFELSQVIVHAENEVVVINRPDADHGERMVDRPSWLLTSFKLPKRDLSVKHGKH
jgi:hypothetical protein